MLSGSPRFQILDKLGEGGVGVVYDAYDRVRDMRVAVKVLRKVDAEEIYRFKREFRALRGLSHPNIVTLYELISEGEQWLLTMEPVAGDDFLTYVRAGRDPGPLPAAQPTYDGTTITSVTPEDMALEHPMGGSPPGAAVERKPLADVVDMDRMREAFSQLARALRTLHAAGVIHRDLKPANLIVTPDDRVVLVDFGIVAELDRPTGPQSGIRIVGTPAFMAPEQAAGQSPSAATDWYAFGVLMYIALTGRRPFEGSAHYVMDAKQRWDPPPPRLFIEDVPAEIEELCVQLVTRDPARRPGAREILARLGPSADASRARHSITGVPLSTKRQVFVGRQRELEKLRQLFVEVEGGSARCVVIEGMSGIGKTCLAERFIDELTARREACAVFAGQCHASETLAYQAFDGVIDDLSHHLLQLPADLCKQVLPDDIGSLGQLFPTLRQVPACDPGAAYQGRDPDNLRARAVASLRALLEELTREQPVIIHIEDLQWADRESLDLLQELLRRSRRVKLLVLGTLRLHEGRELNAGSEDLVEHEIWHRLALGPLPEDEGRELVSQLVDRQLAQRLEGRLWQDVAGNPMLLEELVLYAEGSPEALLRAHELELEEVIWQRVARLTSVTRQLAEIIAVAGEPTPAPILAQAGALSTAIRERGLAVLYLGRLARRVSHAGSHPLIDAYHDKVREAILRHLEPERRRHLHRRLAEALEDWGEASATSMADHWIAAEQGDRAAVHLIDAAQMAFEALAFDRAHHLYELALYHTRDIAGHAPLRCRAWLGMADGLRIAEKNQQALSLLDRAEAVAADHDLDELLARLHVLRGNLLYPLGDWQACLEQHAKAEIFARRAGALQLEVRALGGMGDAYSVAGRMQSAFTHTKRCVELCRQHGLVGIEIANLAQLAFFRYHQLKLEGALEDCDQCIAGAARIGHLRAELVAHHWKSLIHLEMGRYGHALRAAEQSLERARTLGATRFEKASIALYCKALALSGERERAEILLDETEESASQEDVAYSGAMRCGVRAAIASDTLHRRRALEAGERALAAGTFGQNHLFFYREALEAAAVARDPQLIERYAARIAEHTSMEPTPWSRFLIAWSEEVGYFLRHPNELLFLIKNQSPG